MKHKGFTLVELLAVIMILGFLMLIAIPSVSYYINNTRKTTFINSVNSYVHAARDLVETSRENNVNSNKASVSVTNKDTTYYIPMTCLSVENNKESPYGTWEELYIAVSYDGAKYEYYVTGYDSTNHGLDFINSKDLDENHIINNKSSVNLYQTIENTHAVNILKNDCKNIKTIESGYINAMHNNGEATFDDGTSVNIKMKRLAGVYNPYSYTTDTNIKYIKMSNEEPTEENKSSDHIVSDSNSVEPIYMWFEEETGTMYWWSTDKMPSLNSDCNSMFKELHSLISIENFNYFESKNVTKISTMFSSCYKLESVDFSEFRPEKLSKMYQTFSRCYVLKYLDLSNLDTSLVDDLSYTFYDCKALTGLDVSNWNIDNVKSLDLTFADCYNLTELDVSNWNTSNVTKMCGTFAYCYKIKVLDLSNWNTSKVTTMGTSWSSLTGYGGYGLFFGCSGLTSLDLSSFDTSKVVSMAHMFYGCSKLTTLDLSNFNTNSLVNMQSMFENCKKLTYVNLSSFNTSKVEQMSNLFKLDESFTSLDLSNFNTSSLINMKDLVYGCTNLVTLDISNWDTSNVVNMDKAFSELYNCKTIYASSSFVITKVDIQHADAIGNRPFNSTNSVVGGAGSKNLGSSIIYAHIDEGPSNPGYFTLKEA